MGFPWDDPDARPPAGIRRLHDAHPPRFDIEPGVLGPVAKPRPGKPGLAARIRLWRQVRLALGQRGWWLP
jgi:hypothetical protein